MINRSLRNGNLEPSAPRAQNCSQPYTLPAPNEDQTMLNEGLSGAYLGLVWTGCVWLGLVLGSMNVSWMESIALTLAVTEKGHSRVTYESGKC